MLSKWPNSQIMIHFDVVDNSKHRYILYGTMAKVYISVAVTSK